MLMVEGAAFCPETQALQHKRLEDIERQISELESRRVRLMATLAEGIVK